MSRTNILQEPFEGFASPNYTQVPDELFDQLMPDLSDPELRVLLYIVRRTFGFKKHSDDISLSQMVDGITTGDGRVLDRGTGLSKATVARGLARLKEKGIIVAVRNRSAERGNEATTYRLRFKGETLIPLVSPLRQAPLSQQRDTPLSQQRDRQERVIQKTDLDLSKFEGSQDDLDTETVGKSHREVVAPDRAWENERSARNSLSKPTPLGEILHHRATGGAGSGGAENHRTGGEESRREGAPRRRHGRADADPEDRERLRPFLDDFARELGDEAPLASTITRTLTIFKAANVAAEQWSDLLYQARGLTQEHTAQIRKTATGGEEQIRRKNKMPYFLATLEQLVGLRPGVRDDDHDLGSI